MELSEDEAKVDTGTIGLNDDNNEILKKLQGYFKNWKNEWSKKITTENIIKFSDQINCCRLNSILFN
jgi:hypothetical protein